MAIGVMPAPIVAKTDVVVNGVAVVAVIRRVAFAIGETMGRLRRPLVREEPKEAIGVTPAKVNASRDVVAIGVPAVVVVPLQFLPRHLPRLLVAFATGEAMGRAHRPLARVSFVTILV